MTASHSVRPNAARPRAMREKRAASAPSLLLSIMLALVAASGAASAQTILRGTVADSASGEALVGANVYLVKTAHGGVTDREGEFRITGIPGGRYQLRVSYIGYHARELEITLPENETTTLDIRLLVDVIVVIQSPRDRSNRIANLLGDVFEGDTHCLRPPQWGYG